MEEINEGMIKELINQYQIELKKLSGPYWRKTNKTANRIINKKLERVGIKDLNFDFISSDSKTRKKSFFGFYKINDVNKLLKMKPFSQMPKAHKEKLEWLEEYFGKFNIIRAEREYGKENEIKFEVNVSRWSDENGDFYLKEELMNSMKKFSPEKWEERKLKQLFDSQWIMSEKTIEEYEEKIKQETEEPLKELARLIDQELDKIVALGIKKINASPTLEKEEKQALAEAQIKTIRERFTTKVR